MISTEKKKIVINQDTPIEYLMFSPRTYNSLVRSGVETVRDISVGLHTDKISFTNGIGIKSMSEITHVMGKIGFGRNTHV